MEKNRYTLFNAFKDLFKLSGNSKKQYIIGTIFMVLYVITAMLYTTYNSKLIANIISFQFDKAIKLVFISAGIRFFSITVCHNLWRQIVIRAEKNITENIQKKVYKKVLNMSISSFEEVKSGKVLTTLKAAESDIIRNVTELLLESAYLVTSFIMLIVIYILNYKIGLGVTLICTISLILFKIQLNKSKSLLNNEFENTDKYTTLVNETVRGIREVKALNLKNSCFNLFSTRIEDMTMARRKRRSLSKIVNTLKWTVRIIGDVIIFLYIIFQIKIGILDVETAMIIITYMTTVIDDVFHRIIEHDFGISEITANMKRITEVLDDKKIKKESFGKKSYVIENGNINFNNVSFEYSANKEVLKNVTIQFNKCTKNAIIGLSGAGKTTMFKLLLREYDNYTGKITIDGIDIKDFTEDSIRNAVAVVNQEPIIFNMNIKDNLLMANFNASEEEIIQACKLANIYDFIDNLPDKFNEQISENATNISSGQKQRLAIARAILRNTKIILFDEVTSNLDNYNKKKIGETINKLSKTKTVISIVHSLDELENYDNIILFEDGKIVEYGSYVDFQSSYKKYKIFDKSPTLI